MKSGSFLKLMAVVALVAGAVPAQVIINEVHGNGPGSAPALPGDYIELWNQSPTPVNITGWTIGTWVGDTGAVTNRVIPCSPSGGHIIPGNCFWVMQEGGTLGAPLTGTLAGLTGMQGMVTTFASTSNIGIRVLDAGGNCVDYVYLRRGTTAVPATPPNLPAGCAFTVTNISATTSGFGHIHRLTNTDTNVSTEWAQTATADVGTPGAPNTTGTATQTSLGACNLGSIATPWETNGPAASLSINGSTTNGFTRMETTVCTNQVALISIGSTLVGNGWDMGVTVAPNRAGPDLCGGPGAGGIATLNGQVINLDITAPDFLLLNGGLFPPFPGNLALPLVSPAAIPNLSGQVVIINPAHPDGVELSAAVQLHVNAPATLAAPIAGPTGDDVNLSVNVGCLPFCGRVFTQIHVSTNGRVVFGAADTDFDATVADAQQDMFVGYWTDMNSDTTTSPAGAGSINISSPAANVFRVDYVGMRYYQETAPTSGATFGIEIDANTGVIRIDGITGIAVNPGTAITTGDAAFLGLSCGNNASNPGVTTFTNGGSGCPAPTDMIYDFLPSTAPVPIRLPSLVPGTLNTITFTPVGNGYCWSGS